MYFFDFFYSVDFIFCFKLFVLTLKVFVFKLFLFEIIFILRILVLRLLFFRNCFNNLFFRFFFRLFRFFHNIVQLFFRNKLIYNFFFNRFPFCFCKLQFLFYIKIFLFFLLCCHTIFQLFHKLSDIIRKQCLSSCFLCLKTSLLFRFTTSLLLRFTTSLLLCFKASFLFRFTACFLFCFLTGFFFCFPSCYFFCLASLCLKSFCLSAGFQCFSLFSKSFFIGCFLLCDRLSIYLLLSFPFHQDVFNLHLTFNAEFFFSFLHLLLVFRINSTRHSHAISQCFLKCRTLHNCRNRFFWSFCRMLKNSF